jgi:hypothetical protein
MNLLLLVDEFSVCRLDPEQREPDWCSASSFLSITRTRSELSVVCASDQIPPEIEQEGGWRGIEVEGPLNFDQIGILAGLVGPLAEAQVPVFVLSTFETDYLFIKGADLARAIERLENAGHRLQNAPSAA